MTTKFDELQNKLVVALKDKFATPGDVIKKLGLDESLFKTETSMTKPTQFARAALMMTAPIIKAKLAKDQKVDLLPVFAPLTAKTFKASEVKIALDSKLKGKLIAADAEATMGHVAQMLDHIEHMTQSEVADESVSEEQHKAMAAAAGGNSNLGISKKVGEEFMEKDKGKFDELPAFLKEKGMSEDDVAKVMGMLPRGEANDETEEEKKAREEKEAADKKAKDAGETEEEMRAKEAADKKAKDEAEEARRKEAEDRKARDAKMVTKDEMNAAIKAAVAMDRANARAVTEALDFVHPYVGKLDSMALDSAEKVFRQAATMMKIPNAEKINVDGLRTIIGMQAKAGARPVDTGMGPSMGMDSASMDSFTKMFPTAAAIKVGIN